MRLGSSGGSSSSLPSSHESFPFSNPTTTTTTTTTTTPPNPEFVPWFQAVAGGFALCNSVFLLSLGGLLWAIPQRVLSVLLLGFDNNNNNNNRHIIQSKGSLGTEGEALWEWEPADDGAAADAALSHSNSDPNSDPPLPPLVVAVANVAGSALLALGLACGLLVVPLLLARGGSSSSSSSSNSNSNNNGTGGWGGTSSEVAVWNLRTSVTIQLVTGLLWIVVALSDDSSHSESDHPYWLGVQGLSAVTGEEARFRSTLGLLVVGFVVFVVGCAAMMASFWPVGVAAGPAAGVAERERGIERNRGQPPAWTDPTTGDLTEPLLLLRRRPSAEDETTGVGGSVQTPRVHAHAHARVQDVVDGHETEPETNDEECGDSPPPPPPQGSGVDNDREEEPDDHPPRINNNNNNNNNDDDDEGHHTDHDHDHNTSRIQGTRRLLAVAAPQVVYLYVGCITLLVRLPFSLSIPHFVSTTLGALAEGSYGRARKEITWLFVLGTIDAVLDFWCIFWFGYANQRIVREIRIDTFLSILKQDIGFFDARTSGELASRLNSDCGEMAGDLTWFFRFSIESVVRITGITAYMLLRSPRLGACAISIVPLVATVNHYYGRWLSDNAAKVQDALASANAVAQETLGSIRTIVAFASEEFEHNKYKERIDEQYRLNIRQTYIQGVYYMFVSTFLINTIVQGSLLLVGSFMIQRGVLTSEILLAFMLYQGQLQNEMMNLFNSYSSLVKSTGAGDKIFELLDRKPPAPGIGSRQVQRRFRDRDGTVEGTSSITTDESVGIRFESVDFSYPSRPDQRILKGMDLEVPAGSTFALVGPSGCGKSTIVNLLLRFYDASSGRILIDGEDIRSFDLKHHRHRIGIVTQDPVLFSGTIFSNIVYGMPNATRTDAIEAAKQANAHDFICAFPDGYDTQVGERGLQLSGGQKQRIAISRAIIRHPSLLLLDEATSALDAESELLVQRSIDGLLKQSNKSTTTVIVAHRLRTVRNADCIAVINEGRVVEIGSHNHLMSLENGYYRGIIDKSMGDKIAIE